MAAANGLFLAGESRLCVCLFVYVCTDGLQQLCTEFDITIMNIDSEGWTQRLTSSDPRVDLTHQSQLVRVTKMERPHPSEGTLTIALSLGLREMRHFGHLRF